MGEKFLAREAGEKENVIFSQSDPILQAFRDGETRIDLKGYFTPPLKKYPKPLAHIMLGGLLRNYIIDKVKAPLMKAIILAARRLPKPTRTNCYYHNTLVLMDVFDRFFERFVNQNRTEMMQAARDILLAEVEHDIFYAWILNWFVKEITDEVNKGNWKFHNREFPIKGCWKE